MSLEDEVRADITRATRALEIVPDLPQRVAFRAFAAEGDALAPSIRAQLFCYHPFDLEVVTALDAREDGRLAVRVLHFLAMCEWYAPPSLAAPTLDERARRALDRLRELAREGLRIADGRGLGPAGRPALYCDLDASLAMFRALAAEQRPGASWALAFAHPFSLWIAARDAHRTTSERGGKWAACLPDRAAATRAATSLLPAFERGEARLAKVLLNSVDRRPETTLVVYGDDRRALADAAGGVEPFSFTDDDCAEAAGLRGMLRLLARTRVVAPPADPDTVDARFGEAVAMSDLQRELLRAALRDGTVQPSRDRIAHLVTSYLYDHAPEASALAVALANEEFVIEARQIQAFERAR